MYEGWQSRDHLVGLDNNGEGCVFSYDAIGTLERLKFTASGSGQTLIEPFLDNQVGFKNQRSVSQRSRTVEEVSGCGAQWGAGSAWF